MLLQKNAEKYVRISVTAAVVQVLVLVEYFVLM